MTNGRDDLNFPVRDIASGGGGQVQEGILRQQQIEIRVAVKRLHQRDKKNKALKLSLMKEYTALVYVHSLFFWHEKNCG